MLVSVIFITFVFSSDTQNVVDYSLIIGDKLSKIRPEEWFNIPMPVIEAVEALIAQNKVVVDKITQLNTDLKNTQQRINNREKK